MSDSIVFEQDPHPRAGEGVVIPNELGREIERDLHDAIALCARLPVSFAPVGEVFAELRAIRRRYVVSEALDEPVTMEYRLELTTSEIEYRLNELAAEGWCFLAQSPFGILLEREKRDAT